ncbi:MAG: UPF0175 family protein [Acidobacteria bacterium]|nr:UPF0175 family protein [Acidobacteriota bacterium]MCI0665393.1 UPF0175 family protein [Acidobacteriota bacterium]
MELCVTIPDDIAASLGGNIERRMLEHFALDEYRRGQLTHTQLGRLLGFATPMQTDEFLKRAGIEMEYTLDDLRRDTATLERMLN